MQLCLFCDFIVLANVCVCAFDDDTDCQSMVDYHAGLLISLLVRAQICTAGFANWRLLATRDKWWKMTVICLA